MNGTHQQFHPTLEALARTLDAEIERTGGHQRFFRFNGLGVSHEIRDAVTGRNVTLRVRLTAVTLHRLILKFGIPKKPEEIGRWFERLLAEASS